MQKLRIVMGSKNEENPLFYKKKNIILMVFSLFLNPKHILILSFNFF